MNNYVVYHLHTENSLLDSCTNYKSYVDRAVQLNQNAIAFTEHGNLYNWIEKKMYCDENNIKYIHGIECYLTENLEEKIRDNYHTILLAKNFQGVKEINKLTELSTREDHMYYKPRISFDEFLSLSDNIIKISACLASPLNQLRDRVDSTIYNSLCQKYDYYEIQPHINSKEQIDYNKFLYELSKKYNKPLIMGTDTHSLDAYKAECRAIRQIAKHIQFTNEDEFDLTYKSYEELVDMCKQQNALPMEIYLEAINNTNNMAELCENWELDKSVKYPQSYDNEEEVFKKLIIEKYKTKVKQGIISNDKRYLENIKEELRVFKKTNMIGFMLFMSELMTWCRESNIPTSPCRGSVGGSEIAYITDIIDVDPVRWNTVFSRFANEDRVEVGDIDVDIAPDQRDRVYQHIIQKFSTPKTAYILSMGTTSDKGTIDDIGRALSFKWIKDNYGSSNISLYQKYQNDKNNPYSLDKIKDIKSEYEIEPEKTKEKYPELFYYFDGIINTVVSQSMHPAGIVVSPITLSDNYGVFHGKNSNDEPVLILNINMDEVHECGLVKYDILGLKNIQILRECCKYANIKYPLSHEIDWNDKNVWEHIIDSPVGIFQFEGDYAFSLLKRYKPQKINDLSLVNAGLRPSGASYRDRLIAKQINKNPSEQIDELLKDNNGFLVFQEDTIKFLKDICGLSGSEADNIRRAIGRKQKDRLDKAMPQILEGYCAKSSQPKDIAEKEAKEFLQIIEDSSNYQFGYNHSTGYSMVGYLCAYMRYYYPLEFVTAYLNCSNGIEDINNGIELAKVLNIPIMPIKFGKSIAEYTCDKTDNVIYKGIQSIKYCNAKIAEELYELSKNHYDNFIELLIDILQKTSINSRQLTILTGLNFFSDYGKNKYLLQCIDIFNQFYGRKQIMKKDLDKYNLSDYVLNRFSANETDKMYRDIDCIGLIKYMIKNIPNKNMSVQDKVKFDYQYLETTDYCNPNVDDTYYIVVSFTTYQNKSKPYVELLKIKTGEKIKTKVKKEKNFIEAPFNLFSVLQIPQVDEDNKIKLINGKWQKTNEKELVLNKWDVIRLGE